MLIYNTGIHCTSLHLHTFYSTPLQLNHIFDQTPVLLGHSNIQSLHQQEHASSMG